MYVPNIISANCFIKSYATTDEVEVSLETLKSQQVKFGPHRPPTDEFPFIASFWGCDEIFFISPL